MNTNPGCEIFSARTVQAAVETVYQAFADPLLLQKWWGPEGFSNTIHEFNLQPGGKWILTMHGPDKGNYQNASVFKTVEPNKRVAWTRTSQPLFDMELGFEKIGDVETRISFRMIFGSVEECEKIKPFALPKNEENFDRLERLLAGMAKK